MPGFDGTGPSKQGKMTGKGRGYCIKVLKNSEKEELLARNKYYTREKETKQFLNKENNS